MTPESIHSENSTENTILKSERLTAAYNLAIKLHDGQFRKSGEPYFNHCIEVCKILNQEWGVENEDYLIAALLHDTVEDTSLSCKQIQAEFGNNVSELIEGVTKLQTNTDMETLKKVLNKTYLNPGVAITKLADRLHNMRTLNFMEREKQIEKSSETLDVYTKLAESLGIWQVKTELEDLCYKYLDPTGYEKTKNLIDTDPRQKQMFLCYVQSRLEQLLTENKFDGKIEIKKNGLWTLKEKQERLALKGKSNPDNFNDINDVVSFRIRLKSLNDCYQMLKEILENFGEMVDYDKFDQFIGTNKRINGYEALQTTINFSQGPVEIGLVTEEMEEFNKWGVITLIKKGNIDLKDYVLKLVFTPTGGVRFLPKNATGADFAAAINPRVLAEAQSVFVDGIENPLTIVIPNACTALINVGEARRAPLENLELYCLPQTRKIIQEQRQSEQRDKLIKKGQEILESILIPRGILVLTDLGDSINPLLYKLGCQGTDDLYFMIGNKSIKIESIGKELDKAKITKEELNLTTIRLKGIDQPKILVDIVRLISETGKNIVHINQKNTSNEFNLRILIKDLNPKEENFIKEFIKNDKRFDEGLVV